MMEEEDEERFQDGGNLDIPLNNPRKDFKSKNLKLILFLVIFNIVLIGLTTFGIIRIYPKKPKNPEIPDSDSPDITVLRKDEDFIKPGIKLNLEFELVKLKNGMIGLIVKDPYAKFVHAQFQVENGFLTDTIAGLAHLDEHMIFDGSEKYKYYSYERPLSGTFGFSTNAFTSDLYQAYYVSSNKNNYTKAIDIMLDAFRHSLYDEEIIKKEIQAINSEFYTGYREWYNLLFGIIRQLSSKKTSFNGFGVGNNETLLPSESPALSKKLKQYHMVVNRPENIFFTFYSNLTMNESEEYIKNNFNYKMYEFPENELDKEYKKELEKNINGLKTIEVFDQNIYEHGFFFNSNIKMNILDVFFHIGAVNYTDIQFDLVEYYDYLFNSKSLLNILIEKDYITSTERIRVYTLLLIENNNAIDIELLLTEKGLNELDEVLIIIYNYIEIMKSEGFKKEYFDNFIKYKQNLNIKNFKKFIFVNDMVNYILLMTQNYRLYGESQIFTTGTPSEKNYDENKLKNYLNNIKYEKSFFSVNCKNDITKISTFLELTIKQVLNYYKADFLLGKIPANFKNRIKENHIDGLNMRSINPYFSDKMGKDTPCYANKDNNKCKELNEFDFENENKYNATLLDEEDKNHITYYQIDKSSESFVVNAYLEFKIKENNIFTKPANIYILQSYILGKLLEINEIDSVQFYLYNTTITADIECFSDNVEKILEAFIKFFKDTPSEIEFKYSKDSIINQFNTEDIPLFDYTMDIADKFRNNDEEDEYFYNTTELLESYKNVTFEYFKELHQIIMSTITTINLKIAGNVNKNLVQNLHNIIKNNIQIAPKFFSFHISNETTNIDSSPYVISYYQKSELTNEIDNAIIVDYKFDRNMTNYANVFMQCLYNIGMIYLRFNYSNAYGVSIYRYEDSVIIYEQGRYREVTQMEDDINKVFQGMLSGEIQCENYKDIVDSLEIAKIENNATREKTYEGLVSDFFYEGEFIYYDDEVEEEVYYPDNFNDFMKILSPVFTEPKRYSILIARSDISDFDYQKMVENRKNYKNYILNSSIAVEHTEDICYMKNKDN